MSQASVQALRQQLAQISAQAEKNAKNAVAKNAEKLAAAMRQRVPIHKGDLAKSIQVVKVSDATYRVQAGGDLTTVSSPGHGEGISVTTPYDYARATEFGTVNEKAEPFFYNTYRALKKDIKDAVVSAAEAALSEVGQAALDTGEGILEVGFEGVVTLAAVAL